MCASGRSLSIHRRHPSIRPSTQHPLLSPSAGRAGPGQAEEERPGADHHHPPSRTTDALATLRHRRLRVIPSPASCVQSCSSVRITGLCILPSISEAAPSFITAWAKASTTTGNPFLSLALRMDDHIRPSIHPVGRSGGTTAVPPFPVSHHHTCPVRSGLAQGSPLRATVFSWLLAAGHDSSRLWVGGGGAGGTATHTTPAPRRFGRARRGLGQGGIAASVRPSVHPWVMIVIMLLLSQASWQ